MNVGVLGEMRRRLRRGHISSPPDRVHGGDAVLDAVALFVPDAPALGRPNEYTQDRTVGRDWDDDPRSVVLPVVDDPHAPGLALFNSRTAFLRRCDVSRRKT